MPLFLSRFSTKAKATKAFVATVMTLIMCSNLGLTHTLANNGNTGGEHLVKKVDDRLVAATSRFAFKFYNQILKRRTRDNTFVSPTSAMLALAMTYNGTDGTTRQAMVHTLEIEGMSLEEVNQAFADLRTALSPTDPKIQIKIANSLWAKNGVQLKPGFIERNKQYYAAEVASLNFADPAARDSINAWVKKNTEDKIEKIVDQISSDEVLFLINAIYFKGQWRLEFDKKRTKPDVFRLTGSTQKQLPMMSQSGSYLYYKARNFQAVALPYGKGGVSMYVFLPDEQSSLDQFEQDLTHENWDLWMKSFSMRPGDVMLPRFRVEWESTLNHVLNDLGMAEAFDPARADFSQMAETSSGNKLFITAVRQKSWCEVNEEGTVAAAVTSVGIGVTSLQPEKFSMKVDRPFFFAIRDNVTGLVLFMGSVTNPG